MLIYKWIKSELKIDIIGLNTIKMSFPNQLLLKKIKKNSLYFISIFLV